MQYRPFCVLAAQKHPEAWHFSADRAKEDQVSERHSVLCHLVWSRSQQKHQRTSRCCISSLSFTVYLTVSKIQMFFVQETFALSFRDLNAACVVLWSWCANYRNVHMLLIDTLNNIIFYIHCQFSLRLRRQRVEGPRCAHLRVCVRGR